VQTFDVVVLGAGAVGENVADYAAQGGLAVVVIEAELVGGECSYWACMPSKALLRSGHALAAARRVAGAAQAVTGDLAVEAVLARRDSFTSNWDDAGQVRWLGGAGITLIRGKARLAGERRVDVETPNGPVQLTARHAVVVATGSVPVLPPIPGLAQAHPWTSREITAVRRVPRRLAVLGGGVVALEMAQAMQSLGAQQVVVLERGSGLLPRVEPFAGELVLAGLRAAGVDVRLGLQATAVSRENPDGPVTLTLDDDSTLVADELLVATGRRPATIDLGLERVGLEPGAALATDDMMAVRSVAGGWLFAAGDVTGRVLLTHQGKYQARVLGDGLVARARGERLDNGAWGRHVATADDAAVPQVVFTDPEVAAVGLTSAQAAERGLPTRLVTYELGGVAGASLQADGYAGRAALLVDVDRRVLVGATFVGQDVAELLHAATIAVVGEVPLDRLAHAVPSYPTMSEVWLRLLERLRAAEREDARSGPDVG